MYKDKRIGVIIPFFNDSQFIESVVDKIPDYIDKIVIIDDCSQEPLPLFDQKRVTVLKNITNLGVGGATITGFKKILDYQLHIVVKIDADDQMDTNYLPQLLDPLIEGTADFCKGNRFHDFTALRKMPLLRRIGNFSLSFLTKAATGYWNNFDPTNGFIAFNVEYLKKINLDKLHKRFFFETSLQAELYFHNVRIMDIPMEANYRSESSSLRIGKEIISYPFRLLRVFIKRILFKYFLYEFNMVSLYILFGLPLFGFGMIYGLWTWIRNTSQNVLTPTGTIMLITLSIILGFQLILQAIHIDINQDPRAGPSS